VTLPLATLPAGALRRAWPVVAVPAAVAACSAWGLLLTRSGEQLFLGAAPFAGRWDLRLSAAVLLPVALAAAVAVRGPELARRTRWPVLLLVVPLVAAAWAVALALVDGTAGLTGPLSSPDEYLHEVPQVGAGFLGGFVERINTYGGPGAWTTHVAGHPPGALLLFAGLAAAGLGGVWPASLLCVGAGASAAAALLLAVREVAGEQAARRVAPFAVLLPGAVWLAVSADALFLGVTAWGVAALVCGRHAVGGLLLGSGLVLTYGALPLGVLAVALLVRRGRWRGLAVSGAAVLAVLLAFGAAGFWWHEGLAETLVRYEAGAGGTRPPTYFLVVNLVLFACVVGPAGLAALGRLRRGDGLWWLVGPGVAAVLLADLSGRSRGEVERIWLPFAPWVLAATARLPGARWWLAAQAATAVALQVAVRSKW
jgi:methylthioxylose transferase